MKDYFINKFRFLGVSILLLGFNFLLLSDETTTREWIYFGCSVVCLAFLVFLYFYLFNKKNRDIQ